MSYSTAVWPRGPNMLTNRSAPRQNKRRRGHRAASSFLRRAAQPTPGGRCQVEIALLQGELAKEQGAGEGGVLAQPGWVAEVFQRLPEEVGKQSQRMGRFTVRRRPGQWHGGLRS